jgi:glycosyltransferase involved in cell wall biosynthesis
MHIVFITHQFRQPGANNGGIGTFVENITNELVKNGIQATILGISMNNKAEHRISNGVNIYMVADSQWKKLKFWPNWKSLNAKLKEIHAHAPIDFVETPESDLAWINKVKGIQYVIRMNGGHYFFANTGGRKIKQWTAFQERKSFAKADKLLAVSRFVNTESSKYLGFDPAKTVIIPNAIDVNQFKLNTTIVPDENTLLFAGTLVEKKGIRQLILAMPAIRAKHPNVKLDVYGPDGWVSGTKDSYKDFLVSNVPPECLEAVSFKGLVANYLLPNLISAAFACVYPSHMEALPLAWLEAMAMGKPFVASKTGPGPEVVNHGVDGLLVDPYNPADLAEKIIYLLDNKDKAAQLGKAARQKVLANFNMETIVNQNIATYKSWLKK